MSLRNYGSYALFSVLVFLVTCGFLFSLFAPVDDGVGELSTETRATESPLERCDVVIVGAGVGGLYTAFHLSAKLGDRLCLIDDRERAGGKVQSYPINGSDVLAPTCAEQMRDIDVQLRCLCRDLNVSVWVRGEVSLYFHNYTQFSGPNQFETTDDDQGAKYMVKDGPQQVLLKMFQKARERGMRVWQKERVEYLENHGGGAGFLMKTNRGRRFLAQKLVWATPPGAFDSYVRGGELAQRLRDAPELRAVVRATSASVLNLYMKRPFWHNLSWKEDRWANMSTARKYMSFTLEYGPTLQFVATPDRIRANMLRIFYPHKQALPVKELFRRRGIEGVVKQAIKNLKRLPDLTSVDMEVSSALFHFERWAYAKLNESFGISSDQVSSWASQPVDGMCFASEGFSVRHSGWMGGAVDASTRCFKTFGPLAEYLTQEDLQKTWNGECLTVNTCQDECVLLRNERDMRDIATGGLFSKECKMKQVG